ncbi:hypothetical protein KTD26_31510 [Burkholderia multivorans]|uniref:hypothetical protein n=1 Tax=Burkholderia multivorans TaxID=87883 RepID=UPI001C2177E8|nr:hypothetical protein [Burkholderia multivorans]MBU9147038.1 hypothetical protein [Burkholderia multivorans]
MFFGDQQQFSARVSPGTIRALRAEFSSRPGPVLVGTSFDAPPLGSIGDWMLSRQNQNLACYLIPILEHLGEGEYDKGRRRFSFAKPDAEGKADTSDTKTSTMSTESFDGGSLATEAGKMMSRVAEEVTKLALSPVRRIECSLHEIANAEVLRSRLGEWSLPAEGELAMSHRQLKVGTAGAA